MITSKMKKIATLNDGMANNYHMARSYISFQALQALLFVYSCAQHTPSEGGETVDRGWFALCAWGG